MKYHKNIEILYEDNHLLVAVKPVNILSQKDRTGHPDMLTLLKDDIKRRHNRPGNVFLGLVHRLDRPVGGVMVFARTSKAASRISEQIRNREFKKTYLAVVKGAPPGREGKLEHYLKKDRDANIARPVTEDDEMGKNAVLFYSVIDSREGRSLVKIDLLTGRPHQIRAQFADIGCPLAGDHKYGDCREEVNPALWSYMISFMHPTKADEMQFTCSPPREHPWTLFSTEILA